MRFSEAVQDCFNKNRSVQHQKLKHSGEFRTAHNSTEDAWTQMLQDLFENREKSKIQTFTLQKGNSSPWANQQGQDFCIPVCPSQLQAEASQSSCGFSCADSSLIYVGQPSCPCTPLLKCLATGRVLNTVCEAVLGMPSSHSHAACMVQLTECTFFPSSQTDLEPKLMFGRCFMQNVGSKSLLKSKNFQGGVFKVVKNNITHKKTRIFV